MIAGGVRADGVIGEEGRRVSESRGKKKRKEKPKDFLRALYESMTSCHR